MGHGSALAAVCNPDTGDQRRLSEAIRRLMYDGIAAGASDRITPPPAS